MSKTAAEMGIVRMMKARYAGKCLCCGQAFKAGWDIGYGSATKSTFCRGCADGFSSAEEAAGKASRGEQVRAIIESRKSAGPAAMPADRSNPGNESVEDERDARRRLIYAHDPFRRY